MVIGRFGGETFDNHVQGGAGDDVIVDFGGRNVLLGQEGDDNLFGGDDHDRLDGGSGDDWLSGDGGNDIFIFTGEDFGHDVIRDYTDDEVIILTDIDLGKVQARFEVRGNVMDFRILVGEEAQWTASVRLYGSSNVDPTIQSDEGVPVIVDDAVHHINSEGETVFTAKAAPDVFHLGSGAVDTVIGFDTTQDKIGLDVDDALLAQIGALDDNDAILALLGDELGLTIESGVHADPLSPQNDPQKTDTIIREQGEAVLILEDVEDPIDFTQLDTY